MSPRLLPNLGVAAVMTVVIAVLEGGGWSAWVVGAVFALVLALGVWFASAPSRQDWTLPPRTYGACAAVALLVGGIAWWLTGGDNGAFWGVGVVAGISVSVSAAALRNEA
ncbi:hypothetical protein [Nocardioides marmoraquaticus]